MEQINLPSTATISETDSLGSFAVEPLFPGYGSTLGNALRRVLLSSLEGAAVDSIEIEGIQHEFSALPNVKEDVIALLLNLKGLRFRLNGESAVITLNMSGPATVTGASFAANADCSVVNTDHYLATIDKGGKLEMRVTVKNGRGYEPVEKKIERSKTVGVITTDSIYSPIQAVSYQIENTRVGQMTNYDRLTLEIKTDGSIMPSEALKQAAAILTEQYQAIAGMGNVSEDATVEIEHNEKIIVDNDSLDILQMLDPKTKIEDAGFSGRTANALVAAGYKTLSGLKRLSDIKLESVKGLGAKGVEEVRAILSRVE